MLTAKIRNILIPIVTVCIILGASAALIAYGRGYRINITQKSLRSTGLLVVTSEPSGAQIIIEGKVKTAAPATLNLAPGWYQITLVKEGFQPWEKRLRVQGEIVTRAEAVLFPVNPSLTAVTGSGVASPAISPDGSKLAFVVPPLPTGTSNSLLVRPGIYVLDLVDKPLGLNRDARLIARGEIDFSQTTLTWSPDSKQVLAEVQISPKVNPRFYLLEEGRTNEILQPIADIRALRDDWNDLKRGREKEKLATLPTELVKLATSSMNLVAFAPDETKIMYEATQSSTLPQIIKPPLIGTNSTKEVREIKPGNLYVYDLKEDRNYLVGEAKSLPAISWMPTSKHLLLASKDKIEIMEYDGGNRKTVYAGPFWDNFVVPWTTGTKLLILTNLNPGASAVNNLYTVNLR
ncbi:MAG: PEGA domain-containing protein [Patescibacteria group bacterium]